MTIERLEGSETTLARQLADWSSGVQLEAVPPDVIDVAKRCIIDLVGVTLAAAPHDLIRKLNGYARSHYAAGPSTVLGFPDGLSPPGAALVNGAAGHVLDFDDTSYTGIMHGSTVAFPAALAAAQRARASGRRLLEAFIAGSEVTYAVALLSTTSHYFKGWWSTATFGAFGAAAAAARGLGLNRAQTAMAIALSGVQATGLKAAFGSDAKPYLAGRAAAAGVEAATLAGCGISGPSAVLEDSRGFLALLNDGVRDDQGIKQLGKVWRLIDPGIFFKQYPVCSGAHAAVETAIRLLQIHKIAAADVERVICEVPPVVAISLVYDRPATPQQAQFSLPFAIAAVLVHGGLGVACISEPALRDPRMAAAMEKVEMRRVDALHDETAPEGARVTIRTRDGREVSDYLGQPSGMPGNPLSEADLHRKFRRCAAIGGLDEAAAARLLERLAGLEGAVSLADLFPVAKDDARSVQFLARCGF